MLPPLIPKPRRSEHRAAALAPIFAACASRTAESAVFGRRVREVNRRLSKERGPRAARRPDGKCLPAAKRSPAAATSVPGRSDIRSIGLFAGQEYAGI
jgi:hypothetical protein